MRLTFFTARAAGSSTQARTRSGVTAAGATPTLCKLGLYLVDASDNGTLVAATANTTSLWAAANTAYTPAWVTPYTMILGQRYALGQLIVTSQTAPVWTGYALMAAAQAECDTVPRLTGGVPGLSDLPSLFTAAALVSTPNRHYGVILS
jgi:hypothetical protein